MKCDFCDKPAVVHEVRVANGVKQEQHLCEDHAAAAGFAHPTHPPIKKVLSKGLAAPPGAKTSASATRKLVCSGCGLSYGRFRQSGLLGCPQCYDAFEHRLARLIEQAQCGGAHHCGKTPQRAGGSIDRQRRIQQLVQALDQAVAAEQYERAAELRDRLHEMESQFSVPPTDTPSSAE